METFLWTISIIAVIITLWAFIYGYISAHFSERRQFNWYTQDMNDFIDVSAVVALTFFIPIGLLFIIFTEISSVKNPFTNLFTKRNKKRKDAEKFKKEVQDIIDGKKEL